MTSPRPKDDAQKKKALKEFHEKSLTSADEQRTKDEKRRSEHREEAASFAERGQEAIAGEQTAEKKRVKGVKQWKEGEKRQKEEIVHDKQVRAQRAKELKDYKDKEKVYEEKQRKYFNEMRQKASDKAHKEYALYQKDQELKGELLKLEKEALTAKQKADADERITKNAIESDFLRKKEDIRRDFQAQREALFSEESRKKIQLQGPALAAFQTEMQKKRAEIDNEEHRLLRQLEADAVKKKSEAEVLTRKKRADIDAEMWHKKNEIQQKRSKLK